MATIVDTHAHVLEGGHWPSRYFDQIAYNWAHGVRPPKDPSDVRPRIESGLTDPGGDQIVEDMDGCGVDVSLLLPIDWGPDFDEPDIEGRLGPAAVHESLSRMVERHPGRLIAFAGVDPRRPDAVDLLSEAHTKFGAHGLKLYPPMGFYPYDEVAFPIYDYCRSASLPILFHTGPGGFPLTSPRYADVMYLRDVQSAFPQLPIWIGHAGGRGRWDDALSVLTTGANSYLEISTGVWDDTSDEEKEDFAVRVAVAKERFGAHRILFGSDHLSGRRIRGREFLPLILKFYQEELPALAKRNGHSLTGGDLEAIMGGNAAGQLGLPSGASGTSG